MVWRSGRYQVFLIFDGLLTAGLAAMVGLIVATLIHKDWTISGGGGHLRCHSPDRRDSRFPAIRSQDPGQHAHPRWRIRR